MRHRIDMRYSLAHTSPHAPDPAGAMERQMEYAVWWQGSDGPHVERFADARDMLCFLSGWLRGEGRRVVDTSPRIWQVA